MNNQCPLLTNTILRCLVGVFFLFLSNEAKTGQYDLTIVGFSDTGGIGKIAVGFAQALGDELRVNAISTGTFDLTEVPPTAKNIFANRDKTPGNVALLTDLIQDMVRTPYAAVPKESRIKIAYSMVEYSRAPEEWVTALNTHFDAVAVPDKWVAEVYQNSGVKIPIFVVEIGINLKGLLNQKPRSQPPKPFIFGNMGAGKNPGVLIEAFTQAFGSSSAVKLLLHTQHPEPHVEHLINEKKKLGFNNIELEVGSLSRKNYIDYLSNFGAYVTVSNGEGFSVPTREALALGIPVIATNNSALKTLCKSGFVRCIPSKIPMPAFPGLLNNKQHGSYSQCTVEDTAAALKDVYARYPFYQKKAAKSRDWVKRYDYPIIRRKYRTLVKPRFVVAGPYNKITDTYLMTNSKELYRKYKSLGARPLAYSQLRRVQKKRRNARDL